MLNQVLPGAEGVFPHHDLGGMVDGRTQLRQRDVKTIKPEKNRDEDTYNTVNLLIPLIKLIFTALLAQIKTLLNWQLVNDWSKEGTFPHHDLGGTVDGRNQLGQRDVKTIKPENYASRE